MLEEKSDDGLGLASQRSEAREARSHSARQGVAAEPAEHSIENCDAGCLGRRPSIVEEKRLQQRLLGFIPMPAFVDAAFVGQVSSV